MLSTGDSTASIRGVHAARLRHHGGLEAGEEAAGEGMRGLLTPHSEPPKKRHVAGGEGLRCICCCIAENI